MYTMADYFSETFARMSVAYAAAHEDAPAGPGPSYETLPLEAVEEPLTAAEESLLLLPQESFEAYVRESVLDILKAEAAEAYVPEETDDTNLYSAINGGDIWRMVEADSIDFYRGGEAIGESRLIPMVNAEDAVSVEDGRRSLNQEAMNAAVAARLATPAGGYERAFEKDAHLMHIIHAYIKANPSEEFNGQHYRDFITAVKMEAAEAEAERRRVEVSAYVRGRMVELGMDPGESSPSASASASSA